MKEIKINFGKTEELLTFEEIKKLKTTTGRNYGGQLLTIDPKEVIEEYKKLRMLLEDEGLPKQSKLITLGAREMFDFITGNEIVKPSDLIWMIGFTINMTQRGYPEREVMEFIINKFYEEKGKEAEIIKVTAGDRK